MDDEGKMSKIIKSNCQNDRLILNALKYSLDTW